MEGEQCIELKESRPESVMLEVNIMTANLAQISESAFETVDRRTHLNISLTIKLVYSRLENSPHNNNI